MKVEVKSTCLNISSLCVMDADILSYNLMKKRDLGFDHEDTCGKL